MDEIWKYELGTEKIKQIEMPTVKRILSVQVQNGVAHLWVLLDTHGPLQTHTFLTYGSGWPIAASPALGPFIGTYQLPGLVFHVFRA